MPKWTCTGRPVPFQVRTTEALDNCYGLLCQASKLYQKKRSCLSREPTSEIKGLSWTYLITTTCMFIFFCSFAFVNAFPNAVIISCRNSINAVWSCFLPYNLSSLYLKIVNVYEELMSNSVQDKSIYLQFPSRQQFFPGHSTFQWSGLGIKSTRNINHILLSKI